MGDVWTRAESATAGLFWGSCKPRRPMGNGGDTRDLLPAPTPHRKRARPSAFSWLRPRPRRILTSSSLAPDPAATSPRSARRNSASRPRLSRSDYLGGICLNWGCIPTKALLRSAEIFHYMKHAKDYGLSADNVAYDPKAVVQRSRGVSKRLNDGVGFLMKKNKVSVIWGEATIDAPGKITVKANQRPKRPRACSARAPIRPRISSSRPARGRACCRASSPTRNSSGPISRRWCPDKMPKSLLVVGSGAIGIEFASFYPHHGRGGDGRRSAAAESSPSRTPRSRAFARKAFEKQGIKILTGAKVTKLDKKADSVTATIEDGKGGTQTLTVDRVISAVGVVGNIENLGLEKLGVKTDRGMHRHRRHVQDQRSRHLRHRRCRRPADARAQGRA